MARYKQRKRRAPRRKAPAKRRAPPRRSKPKAPKYRRETITQLRRENGAEYTRERYSTAAMRCQVQKGHHYNKMKEAEREGDWAKYRRYQDLYVAADKREIAIAQREAGISP